MDISLSDQKAQLAYYEQQLANIEAKRAALLARIDAERVALQKLIDGHRELIALGADSDIASPAPRSTGSDGLHISKNTFRGMKALKAVRKYLAMTNTGQAISPICDALVEGGMKKTKFFKDSVRSTLRRYGQKEGILNVEGLWWLEEWPHTPKPDMEIAPSISAENQKSDAEQLL